MVSWFVDVRKTSAELQQVKLGIWLSMWKYARQFQIANSKSPISFSFSVSFTNAFNVARYKAFVVVVGKRIKVQSIRANISTNKKRHRMSEPVNAFR